jgi:hypothetical protein
VQEETRGVKQNRRLYLVIVVSYAFIVKLVVKGTTFGMGIARGIFHAERERDETKMERTNLTVRSD